MGRKLKLESSIKELRNLFLRFAWIQRYSDVTWIESKPTINDGRERIFEKHDNISDDPHINNFGSLASEQRYVPASNFDESAFELYADIQWTFVTRIGLGLVCRGKRGIFLARAHHN